jgi:hypothetical protein
VAVTNNTLIRLYLLKSLFSIADPEQPARRARDKFCGARAVHLYDMNDEFTSEKSWQKRVFFLN